MEQLGAQGVEARVLDPFVEEYAGDPCSVTEGCDGLIFMIGHSVYHQIDMIMLEHHLQIPIIIDSR